MRTRTLLTTPPGHEPQALGHRPDHESYVPGLAVPVELRVPGRFRRVWVTLLTIVLIGGGGYLFLRASTSGQEFDPALDVDNAPETAPPADSDEQDPQLPGEQGLPGEG